MEIPEGTNCFSIFLMFFLVLGGFMFFGVSTLATEPLDSVPPPAQEEHASEGEMIQIMAVVEAVGVQVAESDPMQITLVVDGYHPDGCEAPLHIDIRREDSEVYVNMFRELPADVDCPSVVVEFQETIPLGLNFESGSYTIHVNDFVIEVTL